MRLEEALRRDPSFAAAHALLARVLLAEGNRTEAAEHYRRAVALDQMQRDPAGAAADVEHRQAVERQSLQHAIDLVGSAG